MSTYKSIFHILVVSIFGYPYSQDKFPTLRMYMRSSSCVFLLTVTVRILVLRHRNLYIALYRTLV